MPHMQNAGLQPGASRDQLHGWLHPSIIVSERQTQWLASRYCLSPAMAQQMSALLFGSAAHD